MTIKIDNQKISNSSWENVDKTVLRNKLLDSLNKDVAGSSEAIHECYAVIKESDLKTTPSDSWGFAHHQLNGDTLILSKAGCHAAYGSLKGARAEPDLTDEQMEKALSHIKGHYVNDLKEDWTEDKKIKSYVIHLEPEFKDDLENQYLEFFKDLGLPNKTRSCAVFDLCQSLPSYNRNNVGIRKEVLEASYKTAIFGLGDLNHQQDNIVGVAIKSELIPGVQETDSVAMRICAVFWKNRLKVNYIDSISSQNGFSMEISCSDWEFLINDVIYTRQEKPGITDEQVDDLIYNGTPIYDSDGNLVILLAGTLENPIEFSGFGVIIDNAKPADRDMDVTYLEVANDKSIKKEQEEITTEQTVVDKQIKRDGEVKTMFKSFNTEEEYNLAIQAAKNEVETKYEVIVANLNTELGTAKTNLETKNTEIGDLTIKATDFETKYNTEKERADSYDSKLKTIEASRRKQVLSAKNLTAEMIEKKASFINDASDEAFNDYLSELDIYASVFGKTVVKEITAAEKKEEILDIPLTDDNRTTGDSSDLSLLI